MIMVKTEERVSVYQPEQPGLTFPSRPEFSTFADERKYRKEHLVGACRAFAVHGFDYGFAGHLTVRDPEFPELYWTNPMAIHFSQVKMSNLILANHAGEVVEGHYALNRAGFVLHSAVHEAHPDIIAMCHAHTVYGTAWASMGRLLEPITQDAACFFEDHVVIKDEAGAVAVKAEAGHSVAAAFGNNRAALHQNHGLLTASRHSIDDAAFWFIALERCCRVQLLTEAARTSPTMVSPERARYSKEHVGNSFIGWLHFQPVYDQIVQANPDMFS